MRALLLSLFVSTVLSAPQGYNYQQVQLGSATGGSNDFTPQQYQLLQQYSQQQEQQQQLLQHQLQQELQLQYQQQQQLQAQELQLQPPNIDITKEIVATPDAVPLGQTVTQIVGNGGYQFANQLVQQAQQLVHYEQQPKTEVPLPELHVTPPTEELKQQQQQLPLQQEQQQQHHEEAVQHVQDKLPIIAEHQTPSKIEVQQNKQQQPPLISHPQPVGPAHYQPTATSKLHQSQVQYKKEFFYLSAPQEEFEQPANLQDQLKQIKKNLRVVFIKAPENNGLTNAALQLAKQSIDAQTAIYVLSKQHDAADLANKLQEIRGGAQAKPEVVFVKYRTPEEAEQAQRTIQAQYEALDGPNHFNQADVAPSHNFIGGSSGIDPRFGGSSSGSSTNVESATPSSKYLPAAVAAKH